MILKFVIIILFMFCTSCINPVALMPSSYGKGRTGPGKSKPHNYKYRCEKPGKCCEVGKNCEEDKKEEVKENSK